MPRCMNCKKLVAPSFFDVDPDQKPEVCIFCHRGKDTIVYEDEQKYTKDMAAKEYEIFLKMISEKQNIKEIIDLTRKDPKDVVKIT